METPLYKTEGIIIKKADINDMDRLLTIYTQGYGKILARAISARKKNSKLKGLIEPFSRGKFLLAKSRTIDILIDAEPVDSFLYLRGNLQSLAYGFYFSELIDKLAVAPECDDNLWRLISRAFEVLNEKRDDLAKIKILFEEKLLEFLGYGASEKNPLNFIQRLAGEEIMAERFLKMV